MTNYKHLLDAIKPTSYDLVLEIDEITLKVNGSVKLNAELITDADSLKLHCKFLDITEVKVYGDKQTYTTKFSTDDKYLNISTEQMFKSGAINIEVNYKINISDNMVGIYPSRVKSAGNEQTMIATQFESTHAQEAFPCIDEPSAKAVFNLTLITSNGLNVISNTEIADQKIGDKTTTLFEPTPKMSTYLLAFVIGKLAFTETKTKRGVAVKVWSRPEYVKNTEVALSCSAQFIDLLEEFFDQPYPLSKCDLVALPEFSSGAMENWGLCTFRESGLLFDPKNSSLSDKIYIVSVIAHELAHQWFGNLVTMGWWTDLWLNEGFARWMETYLPDILYPEWNLWEDYILTTTGQGQRADRLASSHPVEVEIDEPSEISAIFDAISYDKGASVVGMLYNYLGHEAFKLGLQSYMALFAYKNATTSDLWQVLEDSSSKPVKKVMQAWTSKSGFPVVSAGYANEKLKLSQKRFGLSSSNLENTLWPIPVAVSGEVTLFETKSERYEATLTKPINKLYSGFYITNYDETLIKQLTEPETYKNLESEDKIGLLHDRIWLALSGQINIREALELINLLKDENNVNLWAKMLGFLHGCKNELLALEAPEVQQFKVIIEDMCTQQFKRLGWQELDGESHNDRELRPYIVTAMLYSENVLATKQADEDYRNMETIEDLNPDIRTSILQHIVKTQPLEFKKLLELHNKEDQPNIKSSLAAALSTTEDIDNLKLMLTQTFESSIRLQDRIGWIARINSSRRISDFAREWLATNWDRILADFGEDKMTAYVLPVVARFTLDIPFDKNQFTKLLDSVDTTGMTKAINDELEVINWMSKGYEANAADFKSWLATKS